MCRDANGIFLGFSLSPTPPSLSPTPTPGVGATETPPATTGITESPSATDVVQTATGTPEAAATASLPPTGLATQLEPSATITITPTITISPTVTTTQQYANYKRIWMYYDTYGFYIYNASNANRSISPFSFQRLDENGSVLNRFDGWHWADYFPTLYTARCMRIQIRDNPNSYVEPGICKSYYLSTRLITPDSDLIFWTANANSTRFQVRWQDQPVGECKIADGFCEVFVP